MLECGLFSTLSPGFFPGKIRGAPLPVSQGKSLGMRLFNSLFAICTSPIIHPVPPLSPLNPRKKTFYMTFVYDFSWVMYWQLSQDKLKTMIMQSLGGGGGGQGKLGALWGMCKWRILSFQLTRLYELYELVIVVIDFFLTCMAIKTDLQYWSFGSKNSNSHSRYIIYHKCMYKAQKSALSIPRSHVSSLFALKTLTLATSHGFLSGEGTN